MIVIGSNSFFRIQLFAAVTIVVANFHNNEKVMAIAPPFSFNSDQTIFAINTVVDSVASSTEPERHFKAND
jgi:hypothetical protein